MRLVLKLTGAFLVVVCIVLAIHDALRVRQEIETFEADEDRDHEVVGRALAAAAAAVWRSDGPEEAESALLAASQPRAGLRIRWVCLARRFVPPSTSDCESLRRATAIGPYRTTMPSSDRFSRRVTYVAVPSDDDEFLGVLEVSESAAEERRYVRETIRSTVAIAGLIVVLYGVLAFALGVWLVARPTRALVQKARDVGNGVFGPPVHLHQWDEIGQLAREMNAMSDNLRDARQRADAEAAARVAAVEQLRHADRLRTVGTLASGIAHELGTPLNVIEARATMILEAPEAEETTRASARGIVECSERITRIVRQLLMFAREKRVELAPVDVATVATYTVELLAPIAQKNNIQLTVETPPQPAIVLGDEVLLQQALTNIVMNAIQATYERGKVSVSCGLARAAKPNDKSGEPVSVVQIAVHDSGPGIPSEAQERLFEPFFTTKGPGEGTGLGLSVAYGIALEHGGWIDVSSQPNEGATFRLNLPHRPVDSIAESPARTALPQRVLS